LADDSPQSGDAPVTDEPREIGGSQLAAAFRRASAHLQERASAIDAINVYPVPDGDTGTNMSLTMRAALEEVDAQAPKSAAEVAAAVARGALLGARGNSGVILSQALRGFARAVEGASSIGAAELTRGLGEAASAARTAVSRPQEGTILTVLSAAGAGAATCPGTASCPEALRAAIAAAEDAERRTPELLPILREAGVTDAGGEGACTILRGLLQGVSGQVPEETVLARPLQALEAFAGHGDEEAYGYCTEFVISAATDNAELRSRFEEIGRSVLVVGDEQLTRVHVHTQDPGAALTAAAALGRLSRVKVDDMEAQFSQWSERAPAHVANYSVVAVAPGPGLARVFQGLGAEQVVTGGQTMNPSAGEIVRAAEACASDDVIVLPNNKNVVLAASQAAGLASKRLHVVPTRTVPQGIAALMAASPDDGADDTLQRMSEACDSVRTVEVTLAARSTSVNGVSVAEGEAITLVDDELVAGAASVLDAAIAGLERVIDDGSFVTAYYGADVSEQEATDEIAALGARFPQAEFDLVSGGQPHYPYILAVE
jgi:DAK2 domain fusion protein YloV